MTQQAPLESSTSWGGRTETVRRAATAVLAAVSFAMVAPVIANAAGADVPNPVMLALRSAGSALSGAEECEMPVATPSETVAAPTESVDPSESAAPDAGTSPDAGATESVSPQAPVDCEEDEGEDTTASASPSPSVSAETETETETETEAEPGEHGRVVSTVAKCAPRGKDPLFEELGEDLGNHGAFVRAAAHGDTLTTPWGAFDLSTQAGADALCARLEAARVALAAASPSAEDEKGKGKGKGKDKERGKRGKPATTPGG